MLCRNEHRIESFCPRQTADGRTQASLSEFVNRRNNPGPAPQAAAENFEGFTHAGDCTLRFWGLILIFNLGGSVREFRFFFIFLKLFCSTFVMFFLLLCLPLAEEHTFSSLVCAEPHHFGLYFPFTYLPSCRTLQHAEEQTGNPVCHLVWCVRGERFHFQGSVQGIRRPLYSRAGSAALGGCSDSVAVDPLLPNLSLSLNLSHAHTHRDRQTHTHTHLQDCSLQVWPTGDLAS